MTKNIVDNIKALGLKESDKTSITVPTIEQSSETKVRVNNIDITVKKIDFKDFKTDVLLVWTTQDLIKGDELFFKIHTEAGSSINKDAIYKLNKYGVDSENNLRDKEIQLGSSIITSGGILNCDHIFHCPCPDKSKKEQLNNRLALIFSTLSYCFRIIDDLQEQKPIRKITIPVLPKPLFGEITPKELDSFFKQLINLTSQYKLTKIEIIGLTDESLKVYKDVLEKKHFTFFDKLYTRLFLK